MKLLAPKGFSAFEPQEFKVYVESLYVEPERAAPPAEYSVRLNARGNAVITVRRKPKWLSSEEVSQIAKELGQSLQSLWLSMPKRKIEIRVPDLRRKK